MLDRRDGWFTRRSRTRRGQRPVSQGVPRAIGSCRRGFAGRLVPAPRHLSWDCGVGVRVTWADMERANAVAQGEGAGSGAFALP
jgi:hypothetical protein